MINSLASPWAEAFLGVVALLPAALTWWWGRPLARSAADPALAERLMAHRRRILVVVVVTAVVLGAAWPQHLIWTIPLLLVARAAAALPLRRILLGETWSLGQYLATALRLYLGLVGFWALLVLSPTLTYRGGFWVGASLAVVLAAWNHWYSSILLRLIGARPLTDNALTAHFAELVARSRVSAPGVWRAGPPGAVIANALALPSLRGGSVLFSETLLERLSPEETTAIFGHEVAHLEQYPPRRLRRLYLLGVLLIAAGTALVPALATQIPSLASPLQLVWPLVVLVVLMVRAKSSQAHEYDGDRRGAELCGDAEVLIKGLIKLHAIALLPRRWEQEMERSASHPSLARRIQALRGGAAQPATPALEGPQLFLAARSGSAVAFDSDRLHQYWDVPPDAATTLEAIEQSAGSSRSVRYDRLSELRVAARGRSLPELIVGERSGAKHRIPLRSEDLEPLQRTLDRIDPLLPPAAAGEVATKPLGRLAALVGALTAVVGGQLWSVVLVALLAAWRPQARLLLAAAVSALAATLLVFVRQGSPIEHPVIAAAGALLLAGVALWAWQYRGDGAGLGNDRLPGWLVSGLAAAALAAWAVPLIPAQGSLLRLSQNFGTAVGASTLPLAVAILVVQGRSARRRWTAVALGLVASVPILVGTTWFRDQFVQDPFLTPSPALAVVDPELVEVGRFEVGPWASHVRVSPGGLRVAVAESEPEQEGEDPIVIHVYSTGSDPLEVEATDVEFLDDMHLVTLGRRPNGLVAGVRALEDPPEVPWEVALEGLRSGRLTVEPATGRWRVVGMASDGRLIRFRGKVHEDKVERTEWPLPEGMARWTLQGMAGAGASALWLNQEYGTTWLDRFIPWFASLADYWPVRSSLLVAEGSQVVSLGTSEAQVQCLGPPLGEDTTACLAWDGSTTHVLAVDIAGRRTRNVGTLRGRLWATMLAAGESGAGLILAGSWNGVSVLVEPDQRRLLRFRRRAGDGFSEVAFARDSVALVSPRPERSRVILYRVGDSGTGAGAPTSAPDTKPSYGANSPHPRSITTEARPPGR